MSTAFVASPASTEGLRDGYPSRMRLDTQFQRQQQHHQQQQQHQQFQQLQQQHQQAQQPQDAQSFLSSDSPFEDIGLSPSSYILVSPEESVHTFGSDTGADDWQLMPSPRDPYGVPYTTAAEVRHAQPFASSGSSAAVAPAQTLPRNLSVTSSLSSVAASAGHRHSPMASSPAQSFRRQQPYYQGAQAQNQTFAESVFRWSTAAPMQTLTSAADETVYFPDVQPDLTAVPPSHILHSNAAGAQFQAPWSVHGQRNGPTAHADSVVFAPGLNYNHNYTFDQQNHQPYSGFSASFSSAPQSAASPGTQPTSAFVNPSWPLTDAFDAHSDPNFSFTNPELDLRPEETDLHRPFSVAPGSLSGSDPTDGRSRSHVHDEPDSTARQAFGYTPPPATVKTEPSPAPAQDNAGREIYIHYVPESTQPAGPSQIGPVRSQQLKRVGGRSIGSKFERAKADRIKQRREDGACWTCSLQRDECSDGDTCRRCLRRAQRPNADVVLQCDRTRLQDLKSVFIPPVLTSLYERHAVESFARLHIARWYKKPITVPCKLIWGFEPVEVEMYEFVPKDEVIRQSHLAIDNHRAQQTLIESRKSPPLGMIMMDLPEVHMFNREFDDIVDRWLDVFVERFYAKDEDDFAPRLLGLMAELGRSDPEEHKFLRDVFRLLVVTYVLSHAVTIAESQRQRCLSQLQSAHGASFPKHCGSKLANRQLKHLFSSIRDGLTDRILKQLSQFLKSSKRYSRWTSALCAIVGLAMAQEQAMQLVHLIYHTEARDGMHSDYHAEREGVKACEGIEERFIFVTKLFRLKYHAKFNPLRDHDKDSVREHLTPNQLLFARRVSALCAEKGEHLRDRAHVRIAPENAIKYTARLVAQFMLSFWPPT